MIWVLAFVVGLVAGLVSGGRLDNLALLRFRWPLVVLGAVGVREAILLSPLNHVEGAQWIYGASLAVIVLWTVWHFNRVPGIWLVSAGAALNLLVILANGARMPVAAALAGNLLRQGHIGQYTVMGSGTHLAFLGDWISGNPIPEVYSPGDLMIGAGLAAIAFLGTRPAPKPEPKSR